MNKIEHAKYAKERREFHRNKGLCATGCGRPLRTKWACAECSTKASFKNNKLRNKKRLNLVNKGICSNDSCGKPLSTKWTCRECADKINQYAKNWWNKDIKKNREDKKNLTHKYRFGGFRKEVVDRDSHSCQVCGYDKKIVVHHINEDNKDNRMDNLICLCRICHTVVERINRAKPDLRHLFYHWFV